MLGAIIGDIVGLVYEWHNIKTKEFPLFGDDCFFTYNPLLTCHRERTKRKLQTRHQSDAIVLGRVYEMDVG